MLQKLDNFREGKLWCVTDKIVSTLTSLAGVALTLVIFAVVIARYIFKQDIFGSEEIILLLAWWLYFMGCIGASQEDSQIKADMVDVFVSNQFVIDLTKGIAKALEAAVFFFCTYLTYLMLKVNFVKMPVTTGLKIPYVVSQIPIFIGFIGMALFAVYWAIYFIVKAVDSKKGGVEE